MWLADSRGDASLVADSPSDWLPWMRQRERAASVVAMITAALLPRPAAVISQLAAARASRRGRAGSTSRPAAGVAVLLVKTMGALSLPSATRVPPSKTSITAADRQLDGGAGADVSEAPVRMLMLESRMIGLPSMVSVGLGRVAVVVALALPITSASVPLSARVRFE